MRMRHIRRPAWGVALGLLAALAFGLTAKALASPARGVASHGPVARYCGTLKQRWGTNEVHATGVGCTTALAVMHRVLTLPPSGNSPGSPAGWNCFRITGEATGLGCESAGAHGREVDLIDAPAGPNRRSICHATASMYSNWGFVGTISAYGMTCDVALNTVVYWAGEQGRTTTNAGPTGYACKRIRPVTNDDGLGWVDFRCHRGRVELNFRIGDR